MWDPEKRVYKTVPVKQTAIKQGISSAVNEESALQGLDPDFDKLLLRREARRMGMTVPEYLNYLEKQKQDREYELNIGTEGRAELKRKADELAELKRQQLRKERIEDEKLAYDRAKDKAEREAEMEKIKRKYEHELKLPDCRRSSTPSPPGSPCRPTSSRLPAPPTWR